MRAVREERSVGQAACAASIAKQAPTCDVRGVADRPQHLAPQQRAESGPPAGPQPLVPAALGAAAAAVLLSKVIAALRRSRGDRRLGSRLARPAALAAAAVAAFNMPLRCRCGVVRGKAGGGSVQLVSRDDAAALAVALRGGP
jgi:hypothetical protein